jgi:hypothetical protein
VKIEISSKQLISWALSTLVLILSGVFLNHPVDVASQWLWQFVPEFLSNSYITFLSNALLQNRQITLIIFHFALHILLVFALSQLFLIIWGSKKNSSIPPKGFLVLVSILGLMTLSGILQLSFFLKDLNVFEYRIIILSSKLTPNEIGIYKAKWLMMKTAQDFKALNTAMEQDAKKHHLKFK